MKALVEQAAKNNPDIMFTEENLQNLVKQNELKNNCKGFRDVKIPELGIFAKKFEILPDILMDVEKNTEYFYTDAIDKD